MITPSIHVYDELAEFLASLSPEKVVAFHPSDEKLKRFKYLAEKSKETKLSDAETAELDQLITLERIIRIAKAHALTLLKK